MDPKNLPKDQKKQYMYRYFKQVAAQHNASHHPVDIKSLFDDNGKK